MYGVVSPALAELQVVPPSVDRTAPLARPLDVATSTRFGSVAAIAMSTGPDSPTSTSAHVAPPSVER